MRLWNEGFHRNNKISCTICQFDKNLSFHVDRNVLSPSLPCFHVRLLWQCNKCISDSTKHKKRREEKPKSISAAIATESYNGNKMDISPSLFSDAIAFTTTKKKKTYFFIMWKSLVSGKYKLVIKLYTGSNEQLTKYYFNIINYIFYTGLCLFFVAFFFF